VGKITLESGKAPAPILSLTPVVLVGATIEGKPDFVTVAWTGVAASNPPCISIALQHHRYSLKGIRQNMAFSVNIPSVNLVKETDYCGLVSGSSADKAVLCDFKVFYGKLENAPFIEQCPVSHACEVVCILNLGSHELIIGRIVETQVSEECLSENKPDASKMKPLMFGGRKYYTIGQNVGEAFKIGNSIKPGGKMEGTTE
jgi:flavin reductase (DIM6/NTAB) family NADH-FMN oxidoreductase RutF